MRAYVVKTFLVVALLTTGGLLPAETIVNGSFESGCLFSGTFQTLTASNNCLAGWTITSGSVDLIRTYWQSADGLYNLDMAGNEPGAIQQTIPTLIGQLYQVSFFLSGNPDGGGGIRTLHVQADGGPLGIYSFSTAGRTKSNMGWIEQNYLFTATGASTALTFASGMTGPYGPALDNVSIAAVPEPGGLALLAGALGALALLRRRRGGPART
jgi:choice-of-anchor C domain-containing protein